MGGRGRRGAGQAGTVGGGAGTVGETVDWAITTSMLLFGGCSRNISGALEVAYVCGWCRSLLAATFLLEDAVEAPSSSILTPTWLLFYSTHVGTNTLTFSAPASAVRSATHM